MSKMFCFPWCTQKGKYLLQISNRFPYRVGPFFEMLGVQKTQQYDRKLNMAENLSKAPVFL